MDADADGKEPQIYANERESGEKEPQVNASKRGPEKEWNDAD